MCGELWGVIFVFVYVIKYWEYIVGFILWVSFLVCNSDFEWFYIIKGVGVYFYLECFKEFVYDFIDWYVLFDFY